LGSWVFGAASFFGGALSSFASFAAGPAAFVDPSGGLRAGGFACFCLSGLGGLGGSSAFGGFAFVSVFGDFAFFWGSAFLAAFVFLSGLSFPAGFDLPAGLAALGLASGSALLGGLSGFAFPPGPAALSAFGDPVLAAGLTGAVCACLRGGDGAGPVLAAPPAVESAATAVGAGGGASTSGEAGVGARARVVCARAAVLGTAVAVRGARGAACEADATVAGLDRAPPPPPAPVAASAAGAERAVPDVRARALSAADGEAWTTLTLDEAWTATVGTEASPVRSRSAGRATDAPSASPAAATAILAAIESGEILRRSTATSADIVLSTRLRRKPDAAPRARMPLPPTTTRRPPESSTWGREDSNLRRLSRRFYRPLPLAARAHPRERAAL
jgi:hypothetical protein